MQPSVIIMPSSLPDNGRAHNWAEQSELCSWAVQYDRRRDLAAKDRYCAMTAISWPLDLQPAVISEELSFLRFLHTVRGGLYDKDAQTFLDMTYLLPYVMLVDMQMAQRVRA